MWPHLVGAAAILLIIQSSFDELWRSCADVQLRDATEALKMLQHAATHCNTLLQHTATLMLRDATEASIAYARMNMSCYACTCVLSHISTSHHAHINDSSTARNAHVT